MDPVPRKDTTTVTPRRLRTTVHVSLGEGRSEIFGPGDDVPAWAAEKITNPKAWDDWPGPDDPYAPQLHQGSP